MSIPCNLYTMDEYYQLEDDEIKPLIFTKDHLNHIQIYQKTIELIGMVSSCEMKPNFMKFLLSNSDDIIQCIVWDLKIIDKVKNSIQPGNIVHIDGGFARPRHTTSSGNFKYDLNIMSNTSVRLLQVNPTSVTPPNSQIIQTTIKECCKHEGAMISIEAFIKNPITETSLPSSKINQGCLSDCVAHKLEIRMPSLSDMRGFPVGSHVKVQGVLKFAQQHPYLWVVRREDVSLASTTKRRVGEVLKGTKMPIRIADGSEPAFKIY